MGSLLLTSPARLGRVLARAVPARTGARGARVWARGQHGAAMLLEESPPLFSVTSGSGCFSRSVVERRHWRRLFDKSDLEQKYLRFPVYNSLPVLYLYLGWPEGGLGTASWYRARGWTRSWRWQSFRTLLSCHRWRRLWAIVVSTVIVLVGDESSNPISDPEIATLTPLAPVRAAGHALDLRRVAGAPGAAPARLLAEAEQLLLLPVADVVGGGCGGPVLVAVTGEQPCQAWFPLLQRGLGRGWFCIRDLERPRSLGGRRWFDLGPGLRFGLEAERLDAVLYRDRHFTWFTSWISCQCFESKYFCKTKKHADIKWRLGVWEIIKRFLPPRDFL